MDIKAKALKYIDNVNNTICKNLSSYSEDRGFLSVNILSQLRTLIEWVSVYFYSKDSNILIDNEYEAIKKAMAYIKIYAKYKDIKKFHDFLQKSASHYTLDEENSERLMLKYYTYMLKLKQLLKNEKIDILQNIDTFPLNQDSSLQSYYNEISKLIDTQYFFPKSLEEYNERYYVQKIKPFFVNQQIYYEVTFSIANDYTSKFDHIVAFTKLEILPNYAIRLNIHKDKITIFNKEVDVLIIDDWQIAIRQCEFKHLAEVLGIDSNVNKTKEYYIIMQTLKQENMTLLDIVLLEEQMFQSFAIYCKENSQTREILNILQKCRNLIFNQSSGCNVLRYILFTMNNRIIKQQLSTKKCSLLSNLYLNFGCIPFDTIPFNTSLINHNPRLVDLLECIEHENREDELVMHYIKNNIENKGNLFTFIDEIKVKFGVNDIDALINKYNDKIYCKHVGRFIKKYSKYLYISGYVDNTYVIIKKLMKLSNGSYQGYYTKSTETWLSSSQYEIDCSEKKQIIKDMFENSNVSLIYGAAGTGKSKLINHVAHRFEKVNKIFLANTNPAINNLKRKIDAPNSTFMTINKFLSRRNSETICSILFIDECSTVSNIDMQQILERAEFDLLVLVGDVYQIESIVFGNWFSLARYFVPQKAVFELTKLYRSDDKNLLELWNRVRNIDDSIAELIAKNGYSSVLDDTIFVPSDEDEIILCLNYDGLYGINNINRFLQASNANEAFYWNGQNYKIGDPVLFNETERFAPILYNNLKGKIKNIEKKEDEIIFDIEVDIEVDQMEALFCDFDVLNVSDGKSIVRFSVKKCSDYEEDNISSSNTLMPFQIAYAVSIHKAQGLEYRSVKIIITHDVEEMVTHNIFYTAITRSKEKLKIYWSPETQNVILSNLKLRANSRDGNLLKSMYDDLR